MPICFVIPGPDPIYFWSLIKFPKLPPLSMSSKALGDFFPCILLKCLCTFFKNALLQLPILSHSPFLSAISTCEYYAWCMIMNYLFFFGQNVMGLHLVKPSPFVLCQQFPPFMQSFYDSLYIYQGHCFFLLYFLLMFLFQYSCIQGKKY